MREETRDLQWRLHLYCIGVYRISQDSLKDLPFRKRV